MSAPSLVDAAAMPTMVSRLPKFGSRPKSSISSGGPQTGSITSTTNSAVSATSSTSAASTRLTNGFYHHPGPAGVDCEPATSVKQNGFIRVPTSFSPKWRKENEMTEDGGGDTEKEWRRGKGEQSQNNQYCQSWEHGLPQRSGLVSLRDAKKPATSFPGKGRGISQPVSSKASSLSPQSSPRTFPASKNKLSQTTSGVTKGTKQVVTGLPGSKSRCGNNSSLRQPQSHAHGGSSGRSSIPGSRSGSPLQKKPPASRSQSSDSLGSTSSGQLTDSDRLRSRSLTQVRRQPSPTLTSSTTFSSLPRSLNKMTEQGLKEPGTATLARVSASSQASQRGGGGGGGIRAPGKSGVPTPLPPSALKKPLIPGLGHISKPSGISYKLSRPSFIKQSRPLRVTSAVSAGDPIQVNRALSGRRNSVETPSTTDNSPESTPEAPEMEGLSAKMVSQGELSIVGETLEDMSLSSTSSLDRPDTSQEYMDDFDNLGNGGVGIMLLSPKNDEEDSGLDQSCARFSDDKTMVNSVIKATALCFLDDSMDWTGVELDCERGEQRLSRLSRQRKPSQPDYQGGSSLDLSPSDSCGSGGIYMWDEEGLEPLGGAGTTSINTNGNTTHHIGSFDSDLNSIDMLNNLESCDLDDDDLMLDADFPEDTSLHSDGDGIAHMAQWRRRQLCWGTQDVHNENDSDFHCYKLSEDPGNKRGDTARDDDLILDLCPPRSPCLSPGAPPLGLDVEELAEDCSAVRSQLEYLHKLLLQEDDADDDTLTTDTLSPEAAESSQSSDTQVQALLQEVQQLREELRSRDRTIAQLTLKLAAPTVNSRCCCEETKRRMDRHTQTSVAERESVASQTPWREHTSQVLHPSSQEVQTPLTAPPPPAPLCPEATGPAPEGCSETKERRPHIRSLQLPQPSKLSLFLSETPASPSKSRPPPPPPSCSRLPKPKSH